jgi:uncharacterized membrane protein
MGNAVPSEISKEMKLYALLSYCSLLCLIPLLKCKDDEFVLFHGRQGLALFLCEMAVFVVSIVLPWLMQPFLFLFGVLAFVGMTKALLGEKFRLPVIFQLSERLVL